MLLLSYCELTYSLPVPTYLTITALISDESDNARFQCWELATPFDSYPTVGQSADVGDVSNITYVVLPAQSDEGLHKPPHVMYTLLPLI